MQTDTEHRSTTTSFLFSSKKYVAIHLSLFTLSSSIKLMGNYGENLFETFGRVVPSLLPSLQKTWIR
jgi:hypothetical protein